MIVEGNGVECDPGGVRQLRSLPMEQLWKWHARIGSNPALVALVGGK